MHLVIVLLLLLALAPHAEALPARVKVKLFCAQEDLQRIYLYGPAEILEPHKQTLPKGVFVCETTGGGVTLRSRSNRSKLFSKVQRLVFTAKDGTGSVLKLGSSISIAPRLYRGTVSISASSTPPPAAYTLQPNSVSKQSSAVSKAPGASGRLTLINDVDTRSYITSCVGSEALPSFGAEALKAQTVISTTLLDKNFRGKPIEDSTEEQSYLGAGSERPEVKAAVASVFGQELYFGGRPIDVFFCSTCGGSTTGPDIFGGPVQPGRYPYLKEVHCQFCKQSPFAVDHREKITAAQFFKATGLSHPRIMETACGRPRLVSFEKEGRTKSVSGYQFWLLLGKHFGWGFVPSTSYRIDASCSGKAETIEFVSRGCGHGVGLCQWGAAGQALVGRGYKEILYFYFPGASLKNPTSKHLAHLRWSPDNSS